MCTWHKFYFLSKQRRELIAWHERYTDGMLKAFCQDRYGCARCRTRCESAWKVHNEESRNAMIPWITWIVDAIDEGSLARQCVWRSVFRRSADRVLIELELSGHCHCHPPENVPKYYQFMLDGRVTSVSVPENWKLIFPPAQMVSAWMNSNFASHHLFSWLRLRDFPQPRESWQ